MFYDYNQQLWSTMRDARRSRHYTVGRSAVAATLLLLLLSSCGNPENSNSQNSNTLLPDARADGDVAGCTGLSRTACEARAGCAPVDATKGCDQGGAANPATYAGCFSIRTASGEGKTCSGALTCGKRGDRYGVFPWSCLPADWRTLPGGSTTCCAQQPKPEWTTCKTAADCVVFETQCCDHCNGGTLAAVHKNFLGAARVAAAASNVASSCQGKTCTAMGCAPGVGICVAQKCAVGADPAYLKSCDELNEADCTLSPTCRPIASSDVTETCANATTVKQTFRGCMASATACDDVLTCASKGKELVIFPSSCVAKGWQVQPYGSCCKPMNTVCKQGIPARISRLCLRRVGGGSRLEPGMALEVVLYPKGCWSSSCTTVLRNECSIVVSGSAVQLRTMYCLDKANEGAKACTSDCGGAGTATCKLPLLTAGSFELVVPVAKTGAAGATGPKPLTLKLTLPMTVPKDGLCVGVQE